MSLAGKALKITFSLIKIVFWLFCKKRKFGICTKCKLRYTKIKHHI